MDDSCCDGTGNAVGNGRRAYCQRCQYPVKTCLCAFIDEVVTKHQIIILQHPSEVSQAKGTAKLIGLAMPQAQIVVGETAADFAPLKAMLEQHQHQHQQHQHQKHQPCYLVYPQKNSQAVETLGNRIGNEVEPAILLFLDGSWKKTWKLLQLNPWLTDLPTLTFTEANKTAYKIRKAGRDDSLSTIESVAYCLDHLDNTDTKPLITLFKAMIDGQWRFMSKAVQQRY